MIKYMNRRQLYMFEANPLFSDEIVNCSDIKNIQLVGDDKVYTFNNGITIAFMGSGLLKYSNDLKVLQDYDYRQYIDTTYNIINIDNVYYNEINKIINEIETKKDDYEILSRLDVYKSIVLDESKTPEENIDYLIKKLNEITR